MGISLRGCWMPIAGLLLVLLSTSSWAANAPCSGKKGGIDRCDGDLFLCNDGSISGSKKSCAAMFGERQSARPQTFLQNNDGCACGTGSFCTGPRGGVYCLTPSGTKSYKRK
ncbi:Lipoprotein [Pseudomonas sp. IT-347P]